MHAYFLSSSPFVYGDTIPNEGNPVKQFFETFEETKRISNSRTRAESRERVLGFGQLIVIETSDDQTIRRQTLAVSLRDDY